MSRTVSPSAGRRYGLALVCRVWEVARSRKRTSSELLSSHNSLS